MIELEIDARARLDEYLEQVRTCLRGHGCPAEDVERDVLSRIESALAEAARPVSLAALEAVLGKLGRASRWVPDENRPRWWRALGSLQGQAGGSRPAYLAFGGFVLALAAGAFSPLAGACLLVVGIVYARAVVAFWADRGEVRGDRWLVYSPLIFGYLLLAGAMLLWPAAAVWKLVANYLHGEYGYAGVPWDRSAARDVILQAWCSIAATAAWWAVFGFSVPFFRGVLSGLFAPFVAGERERAAGKRLIWAGAILLLAATLVVAMGLASVL